MDEDVSKIVFDMIGRGMARQNERELRSRVVRAP